MDDPEANVIEILEEDTVLSQAPPAPHLLSFSSKVKFSGLHFIIVNIGPDRL